MKSKSEQKLLNCSTGGYSIKPETNISSLTTEGFVRADVAAHYLSIPIGTLRNLTSNGRIIGHKLGRSVLYRLHELEAVVLNKGRLK